MTDATRDYWNSQAATFDADADHGLRDDRTREAWRRLLLRHLPPAPADVADLGCGTGTLSVLLAQAGYRVRGLDVADAMLAAARDKAATAGVAVAFGQGDAADPPFEEASFDAVVSRHVLWALPDPPYALGRWLDLLRPKGRLVLVEGRWDTGAGVSRVDCERLLRRLSRDVVVETLGEPVYWGRPIDDERYLATATKDSPRLQSEP